MRKILRVLLWSVTILLILAIVLVSGFVYKIKNGFPVFYETHKPAINFPADQKAVLIFSKSTGFRHAESIEKGKQTFATLAARNKWFLYSTEEGGVFNTDQLAKFEAVIFNNSTGRVLNDEQQAALEQYVENGGNLIGIHGAGDDSHHWNWYLKNLTGVKFSHHPIKPHLQEAEVILVNDGDSMISRNLAARWKHTDEWYVFFEHPETEGFNILYEIDGGSIIPNGNLLWVKDKNFGMGKHHPVAWYRTVGKGRTFYTSLGHNGSTWLQQPFLQMLENAVSIK
jgi:type 1 glutamine amidotransferase